MGERKEKLEDWLPAAEAAAIISRNSEREVSPDYMRTLVLYGKLHAKKLSERVVLYSRKDAERIVVAHRGGKGKQVHGRRPLFRTTKRHHSDAPENDVPVEQVYA